MIIKIEFEIDMDEVKKMSRTHSDPLPALIRKKAKAGAEETIYMLRKEAALEGVKS